MDGEEVQAQAARLGQVTRAIEAFDAHITTTAASTNAIGDFSQL